MSTLIGEVSSARKREITKLRQWGLDYLLPNIVSKFYKKHPFKITIKFFIFSDIETTSLLLLSSYIIDEIGRYALQSADYRVIPSFELENHRVSKKEKEGCEIIVEPLGVENSAK